MNFILAFVIFVILGFVQGVPVDKPMVGKVMDNSATASWIERMIQFKLLMGKHKYMERCCYYCT